MWSLTVVGFILDRWTKAWAVSSLGGTDPWTAKPIVIIENYLRFRLVSNDGAVAGAFSGQKVFLILVSLAALVFLFWLFASSRRSQWYSHVALALLYAGALGNLYDRIFNHGKVIDFIEVDLHVRWANPWPIFNVADIFLCVGVAVLLLTLLVRRRSDAAR